MIHVRAGLDVPAVRIEPWGWFVAPDDRRILSRVLIASVLVAAVSLTGCGRRGPLEPPPSAAVTTTKPDDSKPPPDPGITKPDRPFVLDPLL